jgi:mono/diheme cytochrome c family protein
LFAGRNDGRFTALDARDGSKLWEYMTDSGVNAPPIVFEQDGKQYVAVFSAGNLLAGSNRGDSMWLFTLLDEGQETSIVLEQVTPPLANSQGRALFQDACVFCHGRRGEGGHNGMPLEGLAAFGTGYVAGIISSGQNNMPSFSDTFSANQINAIAEHVRTLNTEISNRNNR